MNENITICRALPEQAADVHRIMREAFEEYRDQLVPPTGALSETVEDVHSIITQGGAFLARIGPTTVGSARYRRFTDFWYAERIAVLPPYRGRGVARALMLAFEHSARSADVHEVRVGVRASLPANLRLYEYLGYRPIESKPYPGHSDYDVTLSKQLASETSSLA